MPDIFSWLNAQYAELVAAVHFLSILPLPGPAQLFGTDDTSTSSTRLILGSSYFPLVGLLLGLLLSMLTFLLYPLLPPLALAALLVVAQVIVTGGLHLDGLMDSCDGLFGGKTPERRLEIMRDSRVGSFGVLGGVCVLLLKFAFFASLQEQALLIALLVALPASRWAMVLVLRQFPAARSSGLGAYFRQSVTRERLIGAAAIALLVTLVAGHLVGLLVWGASTLLALLLGAWITRLIGGLTGDSYGAIAEVTEVAALMLLVCLRSWL